MNPFIHYPTFLICPVSKMMAGILKEVTSITFKSPIDRYLDYSVKSLTHSAAPEPSTLFLLGCGFVALATLYRKGYLPSV